MGKIVSASKLVVRMGHYEWKNVGEREQIGKKAQQGSMLTAL